MATDDRLTFVQFPHPGREHSLATGLEWSAFPDHYRRFMVQSGLALDNNEVVRAKLCFWGEWEPGATSAIPFAAVGVGMPAHAFTAAICHKPPTGFIQNTDPLVFGKSFFSTASLRSVFVRPSLLLCYPKQTHLQEQLESLHYRHSSFLHGLSRQ